jgi:hypothetical protein
MAMTNIFKPIRHPAPDLNPAEGQAFPPSPANDTESGASREIRMGAKPVTNMFPSGPTAVEPFTDQTATDEDAWLAMLEIVFAETGWPDAEES